MQNLLLSIALVAGLILPVGATRAQSTPTVTATCKDGSAFTGTKRSGACRGHPVLIPGQVLDPNRILVGSTSNFGAPLAVGVGQRGSFLSIDPGQPSTLKVPSKFAVSGDQASTLNGAVQMFSANSPHWLNSVNKNITTNGVLPNTAQYAGVSNRSAYQTITALAESGRRMHRLVIPEWARLRSLIRPGCRSPGLRIRRSAASTLAG